MRWMGRAGRMNFLGKVGILGNVGKSRICWLTWCVVVGSWRPRQQMGNLLHHNRIRPFVAAVVTGKTVQGGDDDCTAFVAVIVLHSLPMKCSLFEEHSLVFTLSPPFVAGATSWWGFLFGNRLRR